jgi:hypothetical protein
MDRTSTDMPAPSPHEVAQFAHTEQQLSDWGISWPPPKGWKKTLERRWRRQTAQAETSPLDRLALAEGLLLQAEADAAVARELLADIKETLPALLRRMGAG